jgi:hypothetical protein
MVGPGFLSPWSVVMVPEIPRDNYSVNLTQKEVQAYRLVVIRI